jgi:hypothetical protein
MTTIRAVCFCQPIPVLGTSLRIDHFEAASGWDITEAEDGITLYRPAVPAQDVREIQAFTVKGVGYCVSAHAWHMEPAPVSAVAPIAKAKRR